MTELFKINKKSYHTENIYCSIDINNIEKYLKRIELLEKHIKPKIEIIIVLDKLIFNKAHLNWAIFIAKSRFLDKINISKSLFTESLMILSCTSQIKKVSKEFYLKEGRNNYHLFLISEKKINLKEIKEKLDIREEKERSKKNLKEIISFYKIKDLKKIEEEIIEKMAHSLYN